MRCARAQASWLGDDVRDAVAREGELAGEMAVRVLIDDAADVVRIVAREHAVHHHLRDRDLPAHRLAARLEIDRVGEALLGLGARLDVEAEPLGRALRAAVLAGHLALAGDRHAGTAVAAAARSASCPDRPARAGHQHRLLAGRPWLHVAERLAEQFVAEIKPRLLHLGIQAFEARRRVRRELGRIEIGEIAGSSVAILRIHLERERDVVFGKRLEMHRGRDLVRLRRRIAPLRLARDIGEHDRLRVGQFVIGDDR